MASSAAKRKRSGVVGRPLGHVHHDAAPRHKRVRRADDDGDDGDGDEASDDKAYSDNASSDKAYSDNASSDKASDDNASSDDASSDDASFDNASDHEPSTFPESDSAASAAVADTETPLTEASSARRKRNPRPKRYRCPVDCCDKAFDRPVRLQNHVNSHTGERPHVCPADDCDKSFYKAEHLSRHVNDKHGSSTFVCAYDVYHDEARSRRPCGKIFPSTSKLKRHMAVHERKEETTCSWEGCGRPFRKQETLQRHIKKDHLGENSHVCRREWPAGDVCGQEFATLKQLRGHEARAHEAPRYWCEMCTSAGTPFSPEPAPVANDLDAEFLPTAEDLLPPEEGLDHEVLCSLARKEPTPIPTPSTSIVSFPSYHDLQRHNTLVHPPTCTQCGKICRSKKDLVAHTDIEHSGDPAIAEAAKPPKRFVCPYQDCPRASLEFGFSRKGNVDQHVKTTHKKERNFVCGEFHVGKSEKIQGWNGEGCALALVTKQALIGHIRTQHMGLPPTENKPKAVKKQKKKKKRKQKQSPSGVDENKVDTDHVPPADEYDRALSMLTGYGYAQQRPYACILASSWGCPMRFTKEHELGVHMELTHGWHADDVDEYLNDPDIHAHDADFADRILQRRLEAELASGPALLDPRHAESS